MFFQVVDELGRLIAIMLGRFRMTVPDCKLEYEKVAVKVFGKPRHITTLNFGIVDRTKYDAAKLRKVFEEVTERRSEQISHGQRITFPSKRGLCKTLVSFPFSPKAYPATPNPTRSKQRDFFMLHGPLNRHDLLAYDQLDSLLPRKESRVSQPLRHCI